MENSNNRVQTINYLISGSFGFDCEIDVSDLDVDFLLTQAARHKVLSLLKPWIAARGDFSKNSYLYAQSDIFSSLYFHHTRRNKLILDESLAISNSLSENDILHVFRKGAGLISSVYKDPGVRPMMDIDLLVSKDDRSKVIDILSKLDYNFNEIDPFDLSVKKLARREELFWKTNTYSLPPLFRDSGFQEAPVFIVDVTEALGLPTGASVKAVELLRHSVYRYSLPVLDHVACIVDICVHTFKESTTLRYMHRLKHQRLIQYVDLHHHISLLKEPDSLKSFADSLGVISEVSWVLFHYSLLVGPEVLKKYSWVCDYVTVDYLAQVGKMDGYDSLYWDMGFLERMFSTETHLTFPTSKSIV